MVEIEEVHKEVASYVSKFTFALLTCEADERYDLFGTCVAIGILGQKFLLTAIHVVEQLINSNKQAVVALSNGPIVRLDLDNVVHIVREGVELDSCLIRFEQAPSVTEFLRQDEIYLEQDALFKEKHFMQGYPVSKNKMVKINDHENEQVVSGYISVIMKLDNSVKHDFESVNESAHVLFNYKAGIRFSEGAEPIQVKENNMIQLRGLSGCGIWAFDPSLGKVKLAALFFAYKNGVGLGTRVSEIFGKA